MKRIFLLASAALIASCTQEPPVAGDMSESTVCSTAGYLIRQKLGTNTKTINIPCNVTNTGGNSILIESGYKPPIGTETIYYTATGIVLGDTLRLQTIVTSVDDSQEPYPFSQFP